MIEDAMKGIGLAIQSLLWIIVLLVIPALVGIWHIASCTYNHVSIEWVDEEAGK